MTPVCPPSPRADVPLDSACDATVSRTLNYVHSDWAIAQAAALLGHDADAATLLARSMGWEKLLDPVSGFFRVRATNGSFLPIEEFDGVCLSSPSFARLRHSPTPLPPPRALSSPLHRVCVGQWARVHGGGSVAVPPRGPF